MTIQTLIGLYQKEQELKKKNLSLFTENFNEYVQLVGCIDEVNSHWSSYLKYSEVVDKFLNSKIDGHQFSNQFLRIYLKINAKSQLLLADREEIFKIIEIQDIEIKQDSMEFTFLLEGIYKLCYLFIYGSETVRPNESKLKVQTEDDLRAAIKTLFPDMSEFS